MRTYRQLAVADATRAKYIEKCDKWATFRDSDPLLLPADTTLDTRLRVLVGFLAHLHRENRVHGKSVTGYLAAVAWLHTQHGLPHPFGMAGKGSVTPATAIVSGYVRATAKPSSRARRPVSADEVFALAQAAALAARAHNVPLLRCLAAGVFSFVFMARASTTAGQLLADVDLTSSTVVVYLTVEKGRQPGERKRRLVWCKYGSVPHGQVHPFDVLRDFVELRRAMPTTTSTLLFQLPGEVEPTPELSCGEWMTQAFGAIGVSRLADDLHPHSYRRGGATAAISTGASSALVQSWGGWRAGKSMQTYIVPDVQSVHALLFFGQMLPARLGTVGL